MRDFVGNGLWRTGFVGMDVHCLDDATFPVPDLDVEAHRETRASDAWAGHVDVDHLTPDGGRGPGERRLLDAQHLSEIEDPPLPAELGAGLVAVQQIVGVEDDALLVGLGVTDRGRPGGATCLVID